MLGRLVYWVKMQFVFGKEQFLLLLLFFRHEYAVAEKNTVIATCRKLEEQLEDRAKQIQQ